MSRPAAARVGGSGRKPTADEAKRAARTAEVERHGGLICLTGGPWDGHWYWLDQWQREPATSSRRHYRPTGRTVAHPGEYGSGEAYKWVPPPAPVVLPSVPLTPRPRVLCVGCSRPLLLICPGRVRCERCRISGVS